MNINRQYIVPGLINGHPVDLLVDTGANVVALNAGMARRLGISTEDGIETIASTASEDTRVIVVTIDEMQVGGIIRKNVHGVVTPGDLPHQVLLGMSFLQGVDITENAGLMVLTSQL